MKLPSLASFALGGRRGYSATRNWPALRSLPPEQSSSAQRRSNPITRKAWSYLGLTDAMLGRRDEAIQEGKRACEILPYEKDSWVGPAWITNLADDLHLVRR